MYPGDDVGIYQHCATRGMPGSGSSQYAGTTPDQINSPALRFLFNVETWYFARHADSSRGRGRSRFQAPAGRALHLPRRRRGAATMDAGIPAGLTIA